MKKSSLFVVFIIVSFLGISQSKMPSHFYNQFQGIYGKPIHYSDSLHSTLESPFWAGNYRLGVQTNGEKIQDQLLGFPKYGIGLMHANLQNKDTLGNPWAAYMFFAAPIFRLNNVHLDYDLGLGVGWNFSKFDKLKNPKNDLIGSTLSAYVSLGLVLNYQIHPRIFIDAGLDFIHFSNGAMQTPNKGLNLTATHIGLSYYFSAPKNENYKPADFAKQNLKKIRKHNEVELIAAIGGKTTTHILGRGPNFFTASGIVNFNRRYQWFGKYGVGLDWLYDTSLREDYDNEVSASHYMLIGGHLSHEFIISKFSILTQLGTYFYKGTPAKGNFFFRIGIKYYFTSTFFANMNLKTANGFKADYPEFGLGYCFSKNRNL